MSASTILFLIGMGLLFAGERMFAAETTVRVIVVILALASFGAAVGLRLKMRAAAVGASKRAHGTALLFTIIAISSLVLYVSSLDTVASTLGMESGTLTQALGLLWPIVWLSAVLPLLFVDWTLLQMPVVVQPRRIRYAAELGLALALSVSLVFPVNYLASRHYRSLDLRQIRTTAPGEATRAVVEALAEPLDVYLFFPPANDVGRELTPYFDSIRRSSELLRVEMLDHALAFDLAERLRVSSNGSVVLVRGDDMERINLGTTLEGARGQLRRFDEAFLSRLLQLTKTERVVYFSVGHEEMHWNLLGDEQSTRRISLAKQVLERLNYRVAELGSTEGLGRAIPSDAAAVVIAGPRKPFLTEEIASIERYVRDGGRVLLLLEPGEERHEDLAGLFGVRFHPDLVHSDQHHLLRSRTKADRALIATNRFSSHPSVGTLSRHSSRLALILDGAGWLETTPGDGLRVSATVRSMPQSWADIIANHEFDSGVERRETWDIGTATSRDGEGGVFRGAVLASSAAISDDFLGNQANLQWFVDTIRWLTDDEEIAGLVESEEDVRIRHTRDKDVVWFYGTIFAVPIMVLIGGMTYVKRRKKRYT